MLGISGLRLLGIGLGLAVLATVFFMLRRVGRGRTLLLSLTGLGLVLVGLFPALADLPTDVLMLGTFRGGRLLTLLLLLTLTVWFVVLWDRSKIAHMKSNLDRLIRRQALAPFLGSHDSVGHPADSIWVIMPALDEAENLDELLPRLPAEILGHPVRALVVDDGSTDDTVEVARRHGAAVVRMPFNAGGGAALRAGFDAALALDARYIVTMDADGQHDPGELPALLEPLTANELDLVIGSRIMGAHERVSVSRSLGIRLFSRVINALVGTRITDCSSGYRAIRADVLARLRLIQEQYHTAEMIIDTAKRGYRIGERPIVIRRRSHGHSKKGRDFVYGFFFLRTIVKTWLR